MSLTNIGIFKKKKSA